MPIKPIVLQRRHAELGRIRLGDQQATANGRTRPNKLSSFRFTSVSERYIRDLAALYGGEPRPWDNAGVASWEVYTTATTIPVIAVKGGLSQWMETWSGGGCTHRCDGEVNVLTGDQCNPDDRAHRDAKPTTRLSVMLVELEAIGVWRLESHGWNAAAEIPAVAELAQFVGDLVPANLNLVERRSVRDGKTSRFVVPVLDLQIGTARLKEIVAAKSGAGQALEAPSGGDRPALAAAPTADAYAEHFEAVAAASSLDALSALWTIVAGDELIGPAARDNRHADPDRARAFVEAWKAKARELKAAEGEAPAAAEQQRPPGPQLDEDGAVDAEIVPESDDDADAVWQRVLTVGGQQGMSLPDLSEDFKAAMGGLLPDDATAAELQAYLRQLQERAA